jgi:hypothetical protein
MNYLPLPDSATRQVINSMTVFAEHRRVQAEALQYTGGMYWKCQGEYEYLVRTTLDNRQRRLGPRSDEAERTYQAFTQRKHETESRLQSLRETLTEAERLNKAVKAGRVPTVVVALLQTLDEAGLGQHFTVVGTHALYAYETAAGVRIVKGAAATQDADPLGDARRRVRFVTDLEHIDTSMLRVLQRVDSTFRRKESHSETAVNDRGFEVDFLLRVPVEDDPHTFRFSADEEDLMPVQAVVWASLLTKAPKFEHMVISATGKMAMMRTVAPRTFVEFKRWRAESAPHRPHLKRWRDLRQADIVQALLDEGLMLES